MPVCKAMRSIWYICVCITISLIIQVSINLNWQLHPDFQQGSEMCHALCQAWRDGWKQCKVHVLKCNFSLRVLWSTIVSQPGSVLLLHMLSTSAEAAHLLPANKNQKQGGKRGWKPISASSGTKWCNNSFKDCVGEVSWSLRYTANPISLGHIPPSATHSKIPCDIIS